MCGRYAIEDPAERFLDFFDIDRPFLPSTIIRYNIPPTTAVPVIRRADDGKREMVPLMWDFRPHWKKADEKSGRPQQNARAESIKEGKPMFKKAFLSRRCIVPASGYFEWRPSDKQPFYIKRKDGNPMAFAGIWEGDTMATLTTTPNAECAPIHHRMPVILEPVHFGRYLDPAPLTDGERDLLLGPSPDGTLEYWEVSKAVGSVRNQGPELILPIPSDYPLPTRPTKGGAGDLFG